MRESPAALAPRRIGRYEVVRPLARGGMADLVVVSDGTRELALKQLRPELAADHMYVTMFADEARLVALLDHPNIVRVLEVGAHAGQPFFTMELLHGASVVALGRRGALQLDEVFHIGIGAATGLHYAHEQRDAAGAPLHIVHRDVKPHNLFVTCDGVVKVLDFGVARARDHSAKTRSGVVKGTIRYFAPEQCRARPVDARADVFSLAVVLWELLVGRPLYARTSDLDTMLAITESDAPRPSALVRGIPGVLDAILARALARDREARFGSADELRAALVAAAGQLRIALPSATLLHRVREAADAEAECESAPASEPAAPRSGPVTRRIAPAPRTEPEIVLIEAPDTELVATSPVKPRGSRAKVAWIAGIALAAVAVIVAFRLAGASIADPTIEVTPREPIPLQPPAATKPPPAPPAPAAVTPADARSADPSMPPESAAPIAGSGGPSTPAPTRPARKRTPTRRMPPPAAPPVLPQQRWDPSSPLPPPP